MGIPYQLGVPIQVIEPGHVGGGVHTWHEGTEVFEFEAQKPGALELKAEVDPDPEIPEGDGPPTKIARFRVIVPTATAIVWDNPAGPLPWERVLLRGEDLAFRIEVSPLQPPMTDMVDGPCSVRMATKGALAAQQGTKPGGVDVPLGPQNARVDTATNSVLAETRGADLVRLGLVPAQTQDGIDEFTSTDLVSNPAQSSYRDSDGFEAQEARFGVTQRGKARSGMNNRDGDMQAVPPEASCDESFLQAAGAELVEVDLGGIKSEPRLVENQADVLYFSGHGHHATGGIAIAANAVSRSNEFTPANAAGHWTHELSTAIFAGCAVLDIKNYNNNPFSWLSGPNASPGEQWIGSGPKLFLGYNWIAPIDAATGDPDYTRKIVIRYLQLRSQGAPEPLAWVKANARAVQQGTMHTDPAGRPLNACVIDLRAQPQQYWFVRATPDPATPGSYTYSIEVRNPPW
jgi:hypothetical protein